MLFLLYIAIGTGLAIAMLTTPGFCGRADDLARRTGKDVLYGRVLWLGGTIIAWPVGLYVLISGRLILADDAEPNLTSGHHLQARSSADKTMGGVSAPLLADIPLAQSRTKSAPDGVSSPSMS